MSSTDEPANLHEISDQQPGEKLFTEEELLASDDDILELTSLEPPLLPQTESEPRPTKYGLPIRTKLAARPPKLDQTIEGQHVQHPERVLRLGAPLEAFGEDGLHFLRQCKERILPFDPNRNWIPQCIQAPPATQPDSARPSPADTSDENNRNNRQRQAEPERTPRSYDQQRSDRDHRQSKSRKEYRRHSESVAQHRVRDDRSRSNTARSYRSSDSRPSTSRQEAIPSTQGHHFRSPQALSTKPRLKSVIVTPVKQTSDQASDTSDLLQSVEPIKIELDTNDEDKAEPTPTRIFDNFQIEVHFEPEVPVKQEREHTEETSYTSVKPLQEEKASPAPVRADLRPAASNKPAPTEAPKLTPEFYQTYIDHSAGLRWCAKRKFRSQLLDLQEQTKRFELSTLEQTNQLAQILEHFEQLKDQ